MATAHAQHDFDDEGLCVVCGADEHDASAGAIGCEAEVNPHWYTGLARSRSEQRAGITAEDKVRRFDGPEG